VKSPYFALSIVALLLVSALGAPALFAQIKQEQPKQPLDSPGASSAPRAAEGVGAPVDPHKYILGPEDVVFINTWREKDFTLQLAIRPDGKITLPIIQEVQAAGLTPLQLGASLKEKLGTIINNPDVTVIVVDVRSKKYYMDGEFMRPGAYALVTPTTILEAISIAGGFREFADQKHVRILRGQKSLLFNYRDVTKGKHLEQNVLIENGDHVIAK